MQRTIKNKFYFRRRILSNSIAEYFNSGLDIDPGVNKIINQNFSKFTFGQKIKIELEDGTVWDGEVYEDNTVIVDCTPEYMSYYEWNYGGGNEFPTPIDNEYRFEDVKVLGIV